MVKCTLFELAGAMNMEEPNTDPAASKSSMESHGDTINNLVNSQIQEKGSGNKTWLYNRCTYEHCVRPVEAPTVVDLNFITPIRLPR